MVAVLVRLKLSLLRNTLRRSVWRTVGLVLGALYALGLVLLAMAGLIALRWTSVALTADVTVVAFSLISAGWLLLSLLVFGVDETLDPARFALLPVRARDLMPGLLVAGLVSSTGVATVLVGLGLVVTWARSPASALAAVLVLPVGVATCFLLSRAGTATFASVLTSRRFRDLAFVGIIVLALAFGVAGNVVGRLADSDLAGLRTLLAEVATVLGWTPFGWAWAVPADVARGSWALAAARLGLALGGLVALWLIWRRALDQRLTEPLEAVASGGRVRRGGFVDRLYPATPAGAVAARTLRYWRRDPRYLAGIAGFLIGPVIVMVAQVANPDGQPLMVAFAPALLCWLLGASVAQDLSYDGSALWLHASTGLRGIDDRLGRLLSTVTVFGPLIVVLVVGGLALSGEWSHLVAVLAVSVTLALTSLAAGSYVGTLWQWPAPPPGSNPFQKGSSGGLPSLAAFGVTSLVSVALAVPTIALVIGSFWIGWLAWPGLLLGLVVGGLALWQAVRLGGAVLDRRWPEVMAAVSER